MPRHMLPQLLELDPSIGAVTDKLKNAFGNSFAQYALVDAVDELGLPRVLCHGDFWTNNILWKPTDDGRPSDSLCAIIDWQFPFAGNPMFDLARLFVTSMDAERRRKVEGWAIQYYYDTVRHLRCANFDLHRFQFQFP
ncbi:calcium/calmodulin-dependent protein kinase type 1 [Aphelenchoides avenae]|nr:calcium/calmodulin-dependent protein kinase type 1 [Aphelenchus avenae]